MLWFAFLLDYGWTRPGQFGKNSSCLHKPNVYVCNIIIVWHVTMWKLKKTKTVNGHFIINPVMFRLLTYKKY